MQISLRESLLSYNMLQPFLCLFANVALVVIVVFFRCNYGTFCMLPFLATIVLKHTLFFDGHILYTDDALVLFVPLPTRKGQKLSFTRGNREKQGLLLALYTWNEAGVSMNILGQLVMIQLFGCHLTYWKYFFPNLLFSWPEE